MLYIQKETCPPEIREELDHKTGKAEWQRFSDPPSPGEAQLIRKKYFNDLNKSRIRAALIREQKGLCAYCMCRIVNDGKSTTIEHFVPLSRSKAGALDYDNWLAVCNGGRNVRLSSGEKRVICCDAKKENHMATLNPRNADHMAHIAYYDDGTMYYSDTEDPDYRTIARDINEIYGLNGTVNQRTGRSGKDTSTGIVKQRKDTYIAMFDELMALAESGELDGDLLHRAHGALLDDRELEPFVGVKLHVLEMFMEQLGV